MSLKLLLIYSLCTATRSRRQLDSSDVCHTHYKLFHTCGVKVQLPRQPNDNSWVFSQVSCTTLTLPNALQYHFACDIILLAVIILIIALGATNKVMSHSLHSSAAHSPAIALPEPYPLSLLLPPLTPSLIYHTSHTYSRHSSPGGGAIGCKGAGLQDVNMTALFSRLIC